MINYKHILTITAIAVTFLLTILAVHSPEAMPEIEEIQSDRRE